MKIFKNAAKIRKQKEELRRTWEEFKKVVEVDAVKFFQASFDRQGWLDQSLSPWEKRKRNVDPGRFVLIGKGTADLKKSIRVIRRTETSVVIGSDLDYAQIHNEGGQGMAFGKHPFVMKRRQFMGNSATLRRRLRAKLKRGIDKIFK